MLIRTQALILSMVLLLSCAPGEEFTVQWQRPLGEGYSGLTAEGGVLYTLYRRGDDEVAIALAAADGETLWESAYPAPAASGLNLEYGPGPHSTPLVSGDRVFTTGINGVLRALDRSTGQVLWNHDLWGEMPGATLLDRGYSCSPVAHGDLVIVVVGGAGQAVVAFDQASGELVWKAQDFAASPSSPILIDFDGETQLVVFMAREVAGLDPADGRLLWSHPHPTRWGLNISRPVWGEDHTLFISSAYDSGSRALRLERAGEGFQVRELWAQNQMRVHFTQAVRMGDLVVASSGDSGAIPLAAINMADGEIAWRSRDLKRAHLLPVETDGQILALDEGCKLIQGRISAEGIEILSKQRLSLLSAKCWTPPLLAEGRLLVRDRKVLAAYVLETL